MPNVLTTASKVHCAHPLAGVPSTVQTEGNAKLRVGGQAVLLKTGIVGHKVTGCGITGPNSSPCSAVSAITAGDKGRLRVGGVPVVMDTLDGKTNGTVNGATPQLGLAATAVLTRLHVQ